MARAGARQIRNGRAAQPRDETHSITPSNFGFRVFTCDFGKQCLRRRIRGIEIDQLYLQTRYFDPRRADQAGHGGLGRVDRILRQDLAGEGGDKNDTGQRFLGRGLPGDFPQQTHNVTSRMPKCILVMARRNCERTGVHNDVPRSCVGGKGCMLCDVRARFLQLSAQHCAVVGRACEQQNILFSQRVRFEGRRCALVPALAVKCAGEKVSGVGGRDCPCTEALEFDNRKALFVRHGEVAGNKMRLGVCEAGVGPEFALGPPVQADAVESYREEKLPREIVAPTGDGASQRAEASVEKSGVKDMVVRLRCDLPGHFNATESLAFAPLDLGKSGESGTQFEPAPVQIVAQFRAGAARLERINQGCRFRCECTGVQRRSEASACLQDEGRLLVSCRGDFERRIVEAENETQCSGVASAVEGKSFDEIEVFDAEGELHSARQRRGEGQFDVGRSGKNRLTVDAMIGEPRVRIERDARVPCARRID